VSDLAGPRRFWWELLIVLWLYFLYDIINNLSPVNEAAALRRAAGILRLERLTGIDIERGANDWLVSHDILGSILANFYNLAHIWITLALIIFLWARRRPLYADLRNSLVLFNLMGFAVFWLYPVAPPRMLDGFIDLVETTGAISSFHSGTLAPAANQFAAISSASSRAAPMTSASGTTLFTSPISSDCAAVRVRPVKISSAAFAQPSMRGRYQVPPDSGSTPRLA